MTLGLSGFFMNLTNSLVQVVCNATLQAYGGDLYVGVMTIINSLREVFFMPVQGLSNGAQPVTGYNYGAGQYSRVRRSIRFSVAVTVAYAAAFWAVAMLFPGMLIRVFNNEPEVVEAGIPALRIYFCLFIPMSLQMAGQGVFVGLGRSKQAIFFSLLRKAVINAPLTVILPIWMGTTGVFTAEAVSQLIGGLACILTHVFHRLPPAGQPAGPAPGARVTRSEHRKCKSGLHQQSAFARLWFQSIRLSRRFWLCGRSVYQSIAIRMHIVWESELSNKIVKELRLGGQLLTGGSRTAHWWQNWSERPRKSDPIPQ